MQKYFTLTAGVLSWTLNQAKSWNICTLGHKPTRSVQPTFYCLVTQNGSCKIWWAVSKASLKDLKAEESRKGKENKWQLQNICLDAVLCF